MKKSFKETVKAVLRPFNKTLVNTAGHANAEKNLLDPFFSLLNQLHFKSQHIIDVGANHGNWTKTALSYFPDAHYSLLEPQHWLRVHVQDLLDINARVKFYPVGAGKVHGVFPFTLMDRDDSSTFIVSKEQAEKLGFKQVDVEILPLNDFVRQYQLPVPDLIKIDAEGLDLEVLEGAGDFFGKTEIMMVEAAVVSKYVKNDIAAVIRYMQDRGYKLFDITDMNRPFTPAVLWLIELVFVRENGWIDAQKIDGLIKEPAD